MKKDWKSIISIIVLTSFIIPIVYVIYKIVISPFIYTNNALGTRTKADYILMLLQCLLGVIAMILPSIISKKIKIKIPSNIYIFYILFLYAAIFLGEVRNFYYKVPHWDTILHIFSGVMLGAIGFSFINLLNQEERIYFKLSPTFVAFFSFCFSVTLGVLWEIYEYTFDGIFILNMQKFATQNGTNLIGRIALLDTMKDIIVDCLGALIMSVIGYISLKYKKGWIDKFLIKLKTKQ